MKFIKIKPGTKEPIGRHTYYDDLNQLSDAAIPLELYKDIVLIDFDSKDDNNGIETKIISGLIKEYPTSLMFKTDRGYHLYYKTDRKYKKQSLTDISVCGGWVLDQKTGHQYGIVKRNGKLRDLTGELSFDNLGKLPDVLLPMIIGNDIENLCGLKDGDGRHSKLLRHLAQVKVNYSDVDLYEICRFINLYVFNNPLPQNEIENIISSIDNYNIKAIETENEEESSGLSKSMKKIIEVCKSIVKKYDIHISNNTLFYKINNRYYSDEKQLMEIIYSVFPFSRNKYEEILFQLKILSRKEQDEKMIILLKNGSLIDGKFTTDQTVFSSSYLDVTYDENAYDKDLDNFLQFITCNETSDKNDLRLVIEEMIGHCLMTKHFPHKIFLLIGSGANGKSTFLNMLIDFFGDLTINIPIKRLERDDYISQLSNKLVDISDDIDFDYIKSSQNIKTLASGDYITARDLYSKPYQFKNKASLIFSMNELVQFSDHTYGLERRLCIIPFSNQIKKADPTIADRISTDNAKSYLLRLGIEGMKRIISNNYQLTESATINRIIKLYMIENDSVFSFVEFNDDINEKPFSEVYQRYCDYCSNNDFIPCKKNKFSRKLKSRGYESVTKYYSGGPAKVVMKVSNQ